MKSLFRPCIDIHDGKVKQIVGGTLNVTGESLKTNFIASHPPQYYADLYKQFNLTGGHVIMLGKGNEESAKAALRSWFGGLQVGGGINDQNALSWLEAGASKIIVTSYLFPDGSFSLERLQRLAALVERDRLVVDISCRKVGQSWFVAMDKWQRITQMEVTKESLDMLSQHCSEFLIHAADVEGLRNGIDEELVQKLGEWVTIPTTYAGGARAISDLDTVDRLSKGRVDLTYGSSLDIFGGNLVKLDDLVAYNTSVVSQKERSLVHI